jgi:hypothetical protein
MEVGHGGPWVKAGAGRGHMVGDQAVGNKMYAGIFL